MSEEQRDPRLVLLDAVTDAPVRSQWKALWLALSRYLNRDWTTTSSRPTLARLSGLQEHTVRDLLAQLVELGGLRRDERHREDGGLTSPRWTVVADRIVAAMVEADGARAKREAPRVRARPQGAQTTPAPGVMDDPTLGVSTTPPRVRQHTHPGVMDDPILGAWTHDDPGTLSGDKIRGLYPENLSGDARARPTIVPHVVAEVVDLPAPKPRRTKAVQVDAVSTVWSVYKRFHPKVHDRPPKAWKVEAVIREYGEEAACSLIEWAHESDHTRAKYLRDNEYTGATLFRPEKVAEYIAWATEWVEGGRTTQMSEAERRKRDPHGIYAAAWAANGGKPADDDIPY